MNELSYFIAANGVNDSGPVIIDQPLTCITLPSFPGLFSFFLAFGFCNWDSEKEHRLKIIGKDCTGGVFLDTGDLEIPQNIPNKSIDIKMNIQNLRLSIEGLYIFELYLNNECVNRINLYGCKELEA